MHMSACPCVLEGPVAYRVPGPTMVPERLADANSEVLRNSKNFPHFVSIISYLADGCL